ncbi:MAG TPA: hypothetical protein PKB13_09470 [Clostridia bacterium]|nr:hypothetical protein [Clostridia bacterium]
MSERARKILKIAIYASLAMGVIFFVTGIPLQSGNMQLRNASPIEQKMLKHIGIA